MKKSISLFIAFLVLVASSFVIGGRVHEAFGDPKPVVLPKAAIMINITTMDIDRVMMALRTAGNMLDHNNKVTVYLNVEGVLNASKAIPQDTHAITGTTVEAALSDLISRGATVAVCQMCMMRFGIAQADLIEGAILSSPEFAYSATMDTNTQIVCY